MAGAGLPTLSSPFSGDFDGTSPAGSDGDFKFCDFFDAFFFSFGGCDTLAPAAGISFWIFGGSCLESSSFDLCLDSCLGFSSLESSILDSFSEVWSCWDGSGFDSSFFDSCFEV